MWKESARFGLSCLLLFAAATAGYARTAPVTTVPTVRDITCGQFLRLGGAAATEVLYFANGYAAGIEDQVDTGAPAPANQKASPSNSDGASLSNLVSLTLDELRSACETRLSERVIRVIPGGSPVSSVAADPNTGLTSAKSGTTTIATPSAAATGGTTATP